MKRSRSSDELIIAVIKEKQAALAMLGGVLLLSPVKSEGSPSRLLKRPMKLKRKSIKGMMPAAPSLT